MITNTLKKQVQVGLSLFLFFGMLFGHAQSQTIKGKKLLLYTKNGKGYVHDNIATSVATLKKICADNSIVVIIPTIDTELLTLAEHREEFLKLGINIIISDTSLIKACSNKYLIFFIHGVILNK